MAKRSTEIDFLIMQEYLNAAIKVKFAATTNYAAATKSAKLTVKVS